MLQSHEKFHSAHGKRLVLVADDEPINREILGMVLDADYEVIYAENGREALQKIRTRHEMLSIVLLDLLMPEMSGLELLEKLREDPDLQNIPVIVLTSDQESEIRSLELGAADFIPKPYPQPGVILARVRRTIELFEDRMTIQTTERDPVTQLYNRDFFYYYADLYDQYHKDVKMDAIVIDIYHFHTINERFGNNYGDAVLKRIGLKIRSLVADNGGIVCRREADTFLVYCPHGNDYQSILDQSSIGLTGADGKISRVRLHMGVYANADKSIPIERRFDRAARALDSIRGNLTKSIELYDEQFHDKELFEEQLVEDFQQALREKQFQLYYQPKFDVRKDVPILNSAEALIRWIHPQFGFISPATFIPLFEENGLIQELDLYVWKTAAAQIRDWKDQLGYSIPVSVNVSRVDMYDPRLLDVFLEILKENDLAASELHLEVTESAYTQDTDQIIENVNRLREAGFLIEMDDFGTGYSSLNMLSTLPIDVLKLDMQFVRSAFRHNHDIRMIEIIIDIADYLNVPVVAEGVETEEQLSALKAVGCDIIQGYFFSKPVPAGEFEPFIKQRKLQSQSEKAEENPANLTNQRINVFGNIAKALSQDYFSIYYVDIETDEFFEYSSDASYQVLNIEKSGNDFFETSRKNMLRVIHPDDLRMVQALFTKKNLLEELKHNKSFTMTYRLLFDNVPVYVHMKATRMEDRSDKHIVIGVSNIDEQMRQEEEHQMALRSINRDPLTGVKSKQAYLNAENELNKKIAERNEEPFALAVCDLNELKLVNDGQGHQAGDDHIKKACQIICNVFKHSPVYRVGGDEFTAILTGSDYENRSALFTELQEINRDRERSGGIQIACGIAEFIPWRDESVSMIFDRADQEMYKNKKVLKTADNQ